MLDWLSTTLVAYTKSYLYSRLRRVQTFPTGIVELEVPAPASEIWSQKPGTIKGVTDHEHSGERARRHGAG